MQRELKLALLCVSLAPLTGCAKDIVATASVCGSWQSITTLKADQITDQTSAKILKNNEARRVVCNNKGTEHG